VRISINHSKTVLRTVNTLTSDVILPQIRVLVKVFCFCVLQSLNIASFRARITWEKEGKHAF
ncbi:MAG: hypothetical protein LBQ33_01575, partial [Oscillospiraceae bacterium]|nr:hypothetical protein [Oscillospiraceae bacterium]